ncbi:MAG: hypothetical protein HKO98_07155 [Gemmatimonadetes bacterium]|nr:hypothetical protein [Gemmatimonadota bacterium]
MTSTGQASQNLPPAPLAVQVAAGVELDDEALAHLDDEVTAPAFFDRLVQAELHLDATRFLAHALAPRSAVWWAWGCAKQAAGDEPPQVVARSLEATRVWLAEPTDSRRHAAGDVGREVEDPDAAALSAMAAFFAEGDMNPPGTPPGQAPTPPPPGVAAKLAAGAVSLAAMGDDPDGMPERLDLYLRQGRQVARKSGLWVDEEEV